MEKTIEREFSQQILDNAGIIFRICRIYRKDISDQQDLYQEIVLNAWQSYLRFEKRSKFSTWLYRVALNTALYQNRKNKFFGKTIGLEFIENRYFKESDNEQIGVLQYAINKLDPIEKSIVALYLDDLPYKEISDITGLTESNVGVKLNRIKIKLKKYIDEHGA